MIWKVSNKDTIEKLTFYNFLQKYQERFKEFCDEYNPSSKDVFAVIDGQQRLNSVYIGLTGSYAIKLPRQKWGNAYDSSIQPEMFLYLDLCEEFEKNEENDDMNGQKFKFEFFSNETYNNLENKHHWFKVKDILKLQYFEVTKVNTPEFKDELNKIISNMQIEKKYLKNAKNTLKKLYQVVFLEETINYYLEKNNDLNTVIDIFVRANNGGISLSFSDLVMSVISSQWKEARFKIDDFVKSVRADTGIEISKDFVLKAFLYIYSDDIKFRIENFNSDLINLMEEKLETLGEHIKSTCIFIRQIGLNNDLLRAKYALLPLLYYSYKNDIRFNNLAKNKESRNYASIWIKLALIKGIFGGSPDSVLIPIRNIIKDNKGDFPAKKIIKEFYTRARNFNLTDEEIERRVLETHYNTNDARLLLTIVTEINPEFTYEHVDHCYPKKIFKPSSLNKLEFLSSDKELKKFYANKDNWNTLGNLQLLNQAQNQSKQEKELAEWLKDNPEYRSTLIIPKDKKNKDIIELNQFKDFVIERRKMLCKIIKNKITFKD